MLSEDLEPAGLLSAAETALAVEAKENHEDVVV
jgi:hypothetical protein